jgi:hypothetical protein
VSGIIRSKAIEVADDHTHVGFTRQNGAGVSVDARRYDGLDEGRRDRLGDSLVDRSIQRDDPAERREAVGLARADVRLRRRRSDRRAAGVGVLDNDRGRLGEFERHSNGGVKIEEVRV